VPDAPDTDRDEAERARSRPAIFVSIGVVIAIGILVLTVEPLRDAVGAAVSGDTEALREDLRALGAGGVAIVLALAVVHSVVFYPTEILNASAGFVYGFWWAMPLMMLAWMINGVICHQIGVYAARPLLMRLLNRERFERYERAVARGGVTLLIALRLIPIVPFSLFSYVLGSVGVPLWTFLWTSFVGYLPITIIFVLLGSRLEEISITDPVIWIGTVVVIGLLLLSRWALPRLAEERDEEKEPEVAG
jgi:uncharacterized membrane protein YdjX (TVP38/TMEM64 family)